MADHIDTYPELRVRLEDYYKKLVENLQEKYVNYANNPVKEKSRDEEEDSRKFAKSLEQLICEDFDPTMSDCNKNILELIARLRSDNEEIAKLMALKTSNIKKMDKEIEFYKSNTKALQDAMKEFEATSKVPKATANSKREAKAKEMFKNYKTDMNYIIESLYPDKKNEVSLFLSKVCVGYLEGEGTEYVQIDGYSNEVELLLSAKIIAKHPHQNNMFKLNL